MNGKKLIEKIGNLDKLYGEKFYVALDDVLDLVKQLDEPETGHADEAPRYVKNILARYLVKVKGVCGNHETLNCEKHSKKWFFSDREENSLYKTKHTRKELEAAGFGWVFDCPGIQVQEVE